MAATPQQRSLAGSIAAQTRWLKETDRTAAAKRGMDGLLAKFEREVDPEGVLSSAERRARALAARKLHMTRLALASSKARKAAGEKPKSRRRGAA